MTTRTARRIAPLVGLASILLAGSAGAQEETAALSAGDTAWMLTSTSLVLLMTLPGLALFYGGLVRSRNVLSILMQCLVSAAIIGVLWVLAGYSLAFSGDGAFIGNLAKLGLGGVSPDSLSGTIPEYVFVAFQGMFAIITPALMIGAFAERMRFGPYLLFITVWLLIVYVPLAHMVWGGGFIMTKVGALDFAGGLVVHMSSGYSALVT
ncbi:MAG TPA: ammonia channel protein, partial [Candidatus Polarisedimenticolia bacterium]|nr:ammonia channel protein [Candidatus Polarisedimenticolia bacterium]